MSAIEMAQIEASQPDRRYLAHRGCQLAYRVQGTGSPMLLIQGVAVHGDAWQPQVAGLADQFRCLSFDNRGMGQSQPQAVALSVEQMAEDALALMDAEGWESAHIVGHSLGGLIALELALKARSRVRSLALLCTFASGRDAGKLSPRMLWVGTRTQIGTLRQRRHAFLELVMPPSQLVSVDRDAYAVQLAAIFGHDLAVPPAVQPAQMAAMRAYDARARLGDLQGIPTLVVSASYDPIAPPAVGSALAGGIPGSRYLEIPDASHALPIQCAAQTNALLLDHCIAADTQRS